MTDQLSTAPAVSQAFALGWQMAELYHPELWHLTERRDGDLPGLGSLDDDQRREISVNQLQAGVTHVTPAIQSAGLTVPTDELNAVRTALGDWAGDGATAVQKLHLKLLGTLTAADFRLGKAYGLGRALADTCREQANLVDLKAELDRFRIANLLAWLDELSTPLPDHAAHSVYTSLEQWRDWAAANELPADANTTIKRQGELWRALLSGEKTGTETLEIGNYLQAASQVAGHMSSTVWKAVVKLWWVVLIIGAFIAGAVVLFVVVKGGGTHIVAGAGSLLAAFGISWKVVGGALGKLGDKLEQPLWGAVLDTAITNAITLKPGNKADSLGRTALASDLAAGDKKAREDRAVKAALASGKKSPPT